MNRLRFGHTGLGLLSLCLSIYFLPAFLLFGLATNAFSASIYVNANEIKGYINPLVFGQNVMYNSNTMWDHTVDGLLMDTPFVETPVQNENVKEKVEALAPTILRFPGGTAADLCFWEDTLGLRTTQQLDYNSDQINLDDKPQSWRAGSGLVFYPKKLEYDWPTYWGQFGDYFEFTGKNIDNKTLTGVSLLNPPWSAPENNKYPAGVCVRPGGRKLSANGHEYPVFQGCGTWDNTYGIVEHLKLVNSLGAEALLTVNYLTRLNGQGMFSHAPTGPNDTPLPDNDQRLKRAQALVAFCNGRTNDTRSLGVDAEGYDWNTMGHWARKRATLGFPNPFDVRYWEVGNEPYYNIEIKAEQQYPLQPLLVDTVPDAAAGTYANHFIKFAQKMKEVDPKIRVGAAGIQSPDSTKPNQVNWNETVIPNTQNSLDFLSFHPYYPSATKAQAGGDYQNNIWFKAVMAGATQALHDLRTIRATKIDTLTRKNNIGLAVTEYGIWPSGDLSAVNCSNLARALYDADLLMSLIKETLAPLDAAHPLRLIAAIAWNLHANIPTAAIGYNWLTHVRTIRPQFYALKMLRENLGSKQLVQTVVASDSFTTGTQPVGNVEANLSVKYLEALAAFPNTNTASLVLVVLNRDTGNESGYGPDITATITLNDLGYTPGSYKVTRLTAGHLKDNNEDGEDVTPSGPFIHNYSPPANFNFPPHSLTIIEFFQASQVPQ